MNKEEKPAQRLYAKTGIERQKHEHIPFYPKPWMVQQRIAHAHTPLPPIPMLKELVTREAAGQDLSKQTTRPLDSQKSGRQDSSYISPHMQSLKQYRRPRRFSRILVTLLLALIVLCGLIAAGLYFLETNLLGPLEQFFRSVGSGSSSIDGRAWNLLLLGSDNDGKYTFPNLLTQVMMVVHVDPTSNSISMVSIPRDSWVSVPGLAGMHKIDQAFFLGAAPNHSFDDGVRLARATIIQNYGIPIDRYAWVGLGGFANMLDTLGGIDITVAHPILDYSFPDDTGKSTSPDNPYTLQRLYLAPGSQHLNGEQALEYVRSRHADLIGDIGRTLRQQEVLEALKKKLAVSTLFSHLRELFHDLIGKVYTDLSETEMLSAANFVRGLSSQAISHLTLGPGQGNQDYGRLTSTTDPGLGETQDIVVPNCTTIQPAINRIFGLGDAQSCQVNSTGR